MHLLILRAFKARGCQIPPNEAQTSYGLPVLQDEEDRVCPSCSTRDPMQVRLDSLLKLSSLLWYHIILINPALCSAAHRL